MRRTILALAAFAVPGFSTSITYTTPAGATNAGLPVNAAATFVTGAGTVAITLFNFQANPTSVAQNISDLFFTLSSGQTTGGSIASSSGKERTVAGTGTFSDGATVATGWALDNAFVISGLTAFHLTVIGTAIGPAHTVIGPPDGSNVYSNANGSIAGNGPHNPFLAGPVTFLVAIPGVNADSIVNHAIFSFNTAAGDNIPGGPVPEPFSLSLVGAGLLGLGLLRKLSVVK